MVISGMYYNVVSYMYDIKRRQKCVLAQSTMQDRSSGLFFLHLKPVTQFRNRIFLFAVGKRDTVNIVCYCVQCLIVSSL